METKLTLTFDTDNIVFRPGIAPLPWKDMSVKHDRDFHFIEYNEARFSVPKEVIEEYAYQFDCYKEKPGINPHINDALRAQLFTMTLTHLLYGKLARRWAYEPTDNG